jgi:hypothetical protein
MIWIPENKVAAVIDLSQSSYYVMGGTLTRGENYCEIRTPDLIYLLAGAMVCLRLGCREARGLCYRTSIFHLNGDGTGLGNDLRLRMLVGNGSNRLDYPASIYWQEHPRFPEVLVFCRPREV